MREIWDRLTDPRVLRGALVAGAVLAVAGLAAGGAWWWAEAAEARSRQAFIGTALLVEKTREPTATAEDRDRAIRALEEFIAAHARSSLIPQATYRLGNLRYASGQYGPARAAFELALAQGASGTLKTLCAVGIAYTWEAEQDPARAEATYEATLRSLGPRDFLYEEILTDLARVQHVAGNRGAAIETYRRVLRDVPDTPRADEIRTRIAGLESQARP